MEQQGQQRDWASLPDLPLSRISRCLLPSHCDLIAFSSVCRSFRSSLSPSLLPSLPPFLFTPHITRSSFHLPSSPPLPFNPSPVSSSFLSSQYRCIGYSHGHLILLPSVVSLYRPLRPVIVNVITASEVVLTCLPDDHVRVSYYYATLTAPLLSEGCLCLLFFSKFEFLSCEVGCAEEATWTIHRYSSNVSYVARVVTFKGRIFGVNDRAKLLEFDFGNPNLTVQISNIRAPPQKARDFDKYLFGPQLVSTPNQLLLVIFLIEPEHSIQIYSLNFKNKQWDQVIELRDRAIFIDCGGKAAVSCEKPEIWGGRSNCVYMAGPGCQTWGCFSLDEKTVIPFLDSRVIGPYPAQWPSPIWVHPSLFFDRFVMVLGQKFSF